MIVFIKKAYAHSILTSHDVKLIQAYLAKPQSTLIIRSPVQTFDFRETESKFWNISIDDIVNRYYEKCISDQNPDFLSADSNIICVIGNEKPYSLATDKFVSMNQFKSYFKALIVQTIREIIYKPSNPS